jgi:glycosyltransferase involved in cell wall biosynthesis
MRRVLLVTYFFPPLGGGGVPRALKLAKYLPAFGWEPHVLTVRDGVWSAWDPSPLAELPEEVRIHRTPIFLPGVAAKRLGVRLSLFSFRGGRGGEHGNAPVAASPGRLEGLRERFRKVAYLPDAFIGWYPFAVRAGRRIVREQGIDAVISTSPPHTAHLAARAIARGTGLPWVADFRDAWTRDPNFRFAVGWRGRIEQRLERRVVRDASRIVTVSEPIRDDFLADHPALGPCAVDVIPNGFDPDDFRGGPLAPEIQERLAPDPGRFRIAYAGGLIGGRSPRAFLEALAACARAGGPRVEAVIAGTEQDAFRAEAASAGVADRVHTVGYLPQRESCALLRAADAALLLVGDLPGSGGIVSGKVYQYLGAGRPILALAPEGAAAQLVRKTGAGIVLPPDDVRGAARVLNDWARAKAAGAPVSGADRDAVAAYTRRRAAERFARVLEGVTRG